MNVVTCVERRRACGYRQPGGTYLVGQGLASPCGKIPIPLDTCPTCGSGIRFQRAIQWVITKTLFEGRTCRMGWCADCPLSDAKMPDRAGLLWVGSTQYPTPESFIYEAEMMGVSKRIHTIPKGLVIGETLFLLAHRFAIGNRAGIFFAFIPTGIDYVMTGNETEGELAFKEQMGVRLVRVIPEEGRLFR